MLLIPSFRTSVQVPLFFTRQALYSSIYVTSIFLVLLPVSVVSYLNFYRMLIPTERIRLPTQLVDYEATIDGTSVLPFLQKNKDLRFVVQGSLHVVCNTENAYLTVWYDYELLKQLLYKDQVIVNCETQDMYTHNNNWVPYNLRYWVPPILTNTHRVVDVTFPIVHVTGEQLHAFVKARKQVLRLSHASGMLVDSRKTFVDFVIEWDGIRYYLVRYYFLSLAIGVFIFWVLSSWVFTLSSLACLAYFSLDSPQVEQRPRPVPRRKPGATKKEF